ncbi:hypothetical protein O53_2219 [Microcystis aeruginosa TAIHU98]|uniref:Uncharacterized protein n=1 Tax=Microcystis aeruginosa TAIHU98 TaxID=1134457 RepID=L7E1U1_MICAE|nr:hypothetical protein O53_2219 [Microcystis aeruginosa TAIHU98]
METSFRKNKPFCRPIKSLYSLEKLIEWKLPYPKKDDAKQTNSLLAREIN